ncbi:response regulator receiver domain protein [Leptospira ryugenii]|uniref:Response regulator receiver domain protein n=1 Tax=Leptospira ryugenii TaxID=1917863 RepID=A0A2P2DVN1_9LEPT|nr:response regulator [Leptospira ryugenii]GBF48667.1 response regulator receiver domain protein [Leptospira ryugenii]
MSVNAVLEKAILFVDDELLILLSMSMQCKRYFGDEIRYLTAQNPREALEILNELEEEKDTELIGVVSDWSMPGMNGGEFLKLVHQKFPKIPKIILSGQAEESSVRDLEKEISHFTFVKKPWDELQIVEIIKGAIDQKDQT